jgi:hypothetical protein
LHQGEALAGLSRQAAKQTHSCLIWVLTSETLYEKHLLKNMFTRREPYESSHREQSVSTYQQLPRLTICMFGHDVSDTHALVNYVVEMTMQHGVNLLHLDGDW